MFRKWIYRLVGFAFILMGICACNSEEDKAPKWQTTWIAAQQQVTKDDQLPPIDFEGNTVRQMLQITLGGDQFRFTFSNEYGESPLVLNKVNVAKAATPGEINVGTLTPITFGGTSSTTIAMGQKVTSDVVNLTAAPLTNLSVTIFFGAQVPAAITGHPGSRTTTFFQTGDQSNAAQLTGPSIERWYYISQLDVMAPGNSAAVVCVGDSITDGKGSSTDQNNRWTNILAQRLLNDDATKHIAVLNQGIGANNLASSGGDSPSALERFERDVIDNPINVKWVIIYEGINDILYASAFANRLTDAYTQMAEQAHAAGINVIGGTIMPADLSESREAVRVEVNDWIRNAAQSGIFDGLIDFDQLCADGSTLKPECRGDDSIHPSPAGHALMGNEVELSLFTD